MMVVTGGTGSIPVSSYLCAMPCPELTSRTVLPGFLGVEVVRLLLDGGYAVRVSHTHDPNPLFLPCVRFAMRTALTFSDSLSSLFSFFSLLLICPTRVPS